MAHPAKLIQHVEQSADRSNERFACGPEIHLDAEETRDVLALMSEPAEPIPALVRAIKATRHLW
jgi:hypothetical protein